MTVARDRSLRVLIALAIVVLGLLEVQGLLQTLRGHGRLRERVAHGLRDRLSTARPRVADSIRPGGEAAWRAACEDVLRLLPGSEIEVFDEAGRRLFALPEPAPVGHWLSTADLASVRAGAVVAQGPVAGRATRLLSYLAFASGDATVVLRVASTSADLVEDLRERRQALLGHAVALLILGLAAVVALAPLRSPGSPTSPGALAAYEAAMGRMREQEQDRSRVHAEERRALEETLRDKEAMARAGELTAGIAHEVRNGLATIVGYARLVERGEPSLLPAEAARLILAECATLESVVRRFVDYVRRDTLRLAPVDLGRLLARVAGRESAAHPVAALALPAPGSGPQIAGDEELLERALENLVRNALEAAGPSGHVGLHVATEADVVTVAVEDDGPGLPPEGRRPFSTTKPGGLGLGLPLAAKILDLHGGQLSFEPRVPRGTRVLVRLAVDGPEWESSATEGSGPAARKPDVSLGNDGLKR